MEKQKASQNTQRVCLFLFFSLPGKSRLCACWQTNKTSLIWLTLVNRTSHIGNDIFHFPPKTQYLQKGTCPMVHGMPNLMHAHVSISLKISYIHTYIASFAQNNLNVCSLFQDYFKIFLSQRTHFSWIVHLQSQQYAHMLLLMGRVVTPKGQHCYSILPSCCCSYYVMQSLSHIFSTRTLQLKIPLIFKISSLVVVDTVVTRMVWLLLKYNFQHFNC